jgi:hypothetical protein
MSAVGLVKEFTVVGTVPRELGIPLEKSIFLSLSTIDH